MHVQRVRTGILVCLVGVVLRAHRYSHMCTHTGCSRALTPLHRAGPFKDLLSQWAASSKVPLGFGKLLKRSARPAQHPAHPFASFKATPSVSMWGCACGCEWAGICV